MMSDTKLKEKFIGYVDILGFKKMVEATEAGTGMPLSELLEITKLLGVPEGRKNYLKNGPTTCPESKYFHRDLDFQLTQISDCVIVSSEISPAGLINLIHHCWGAVINLLTKGIMCRGYITRGKIYHTEDQIIGSGYNEALSKEKKVAAFKREANERGTPFVEVDQTICDYVKNHDDPCVKEMFSRMVKEDGEVIVLFPFQRLAHSFMVAGFGIKFDPQEEKKSNQNMRLFINKLKERVMEFVDQSNESAVRKAEHYIKALDSQLDICNKTDAVIDMLSRKI